MEIKYKTFYGEDFNSDQECLDAEMKRKSNTFYVKISSKPDLCETGCMQKCDYFRVFSEKIEKDICVFLILKELGINLVGESVIGYGYQEHCFYRFITEDEFNNPKPIIWGGSAMKYDKYDVIVQKETTIKKL